mmetsp:Transcript_32482/g.100506  ORF Transcript_32482/g.100506 Transcript_32482/m.100506 type:complete len:453 (+) Transcript_32482:1830-3188(+)
MRRIYAKAGEGLVDAGAAVACSDWYLFTWSRPRYARGFGHLIFKMEDKKFIVRILHELTRTGKVATQDYKLQAWITLSQMLARRSLARCEAFTLQTRFWRLDMAKKQCLIADTQNRFFPEAALSQEDCPVVIRVAEDEIAKWQRIAEEASSRFRKTRAEISIHINKNADIVAMLNRSSSRWKEREMALQISKYSAAETEKAVVLETSMKFAAMLKELTVARNAEAKAQNRVSLVRQELMALRHCVRLLCRGQNSGSTPAAEQAKSKSISRIGTEIKAKSMPNPDSLDPHHQEDKKQLQKRSGLLLPARQMQAKSMAASTTGLEILRGEVDKRALKKKYLKSIKSLVEYSVALGHRVGTNSSSDFVWHQEKRLRASSLMRLVKFRKSLRPLCGFILSKKQALRCACAQRLKLRRFSGLVKETAAYALFVSAVEHELVAFKLLEIFKGLTAPHL